MHVVRYVLNANLCKQVMHALITEHNNLFYVVVAANMCFFLHILKLMDFLSYIQSLRPLQLLSYTPGNWPVHQWPEYLLIMHTFQLHKSTLMHLPGITS